jgi:hypothetical protein
MLDPLASEMRSHGPDIRPAKVDHLTSPRGKLHSTAFAFGGLALGVLLVLAWAMTSLRRTLGSPESRRPASFTFLYEGEPLPGRRDWTESQLRPGV